MISLLCLEETKGCGKPAGLASFIKNYSFSYHHISFGMITIRNATSADAAILREKIYKPLYVHAGNAKILFDPCSSESYTRRGGLFYLPSESDLSELINKGFVLIASCRKEKGEEIMAVVSGCIADVSNDILDVVDADCLNGEDVRIERFPSLNNQPLFDNRPRLINKNALYRVLGNASLRDVSIIPLRDFIVVPEYRESGIAEFVTYKIVRILKSFYDCSYFLSELYRIDRIEVNGAALLDKNNHPLTMYDIESKIERREILKAEEIGSSEPFRKRLDYIHNAGDEQHAHDIVEIEIRASLLLSNCDSILNSVPPSNRRNSVIPVPVIV